MAPGSMMQATTALAVVAVTAGCAAPYETALRADIDRARRDRREREEASTPADLDGSLSAYEAYAMARSPGLRAAFERWQAAVHRIAAARGLPEPTITYGYYVQSVETRVGPQRHRLGLTQWLPWPTTVTAGADAAAAAARAEQRRFDAADLSLRARVANAYYRGWLVEQTRSIRRDQLEVLVSLGEVMRSRVEVGGATLADVQQVDLAAARARDALAALAEEERVALATLRAAIGARHGVATPVEGEALPERALPAEGEDSLREAVAAHPHVEALALMGEAGTSRARAARGRRFPGLALGVDWIETGEATMDDVADSGRDAVVLRVGLRLPLWQGAARGSEAAAEAEARAFAAEAEEAVTRAEAELDRALSGLSDSHRRIDLYETTLIPQAETTYAAVVSAYQTGRSTVAAALRAQQELLDLELGLARARVDHAQSWARLEEVAGRPVERGSQGGEP